LTGTENIRDTTFYPRDVDRLTPWFYTSFVDLWDKM